MFLEGTRAVAASGITISRAPERIWQQHFSTLGVQPELSRTDLIQRVMGSGGRWVSIEGSPGMGRTTLLGQIADQFFESGDWFHAIWTNLQLREAFDFSGYRRTRDLRPLIRWLQICSTSSVSGYATLLIDDYDLLLHDEHREILDALLIAVPTLRLISTNVSPISPSAALVQRGISQVTRIAARELLFTREESGRLVEAAANQNPQSNVLADSNAVELLHSRTRGVPLGVALALDRLAFSNEQLEHQVSQVMNFFFTDLLRLHLRTMDTRGLSALFSKFSLMPRFSYLHISTCFSGVTPETLDAFADSPAIDARRRVRTGEYTWSEEFLDAARDLNASRIVERRELAMQLYQGNYAGGAFEQWFLAGDLARAEAMLRTRFLTVYETLSPETAAEMCGVAPTDLAAYPMIRVMQMLLDPRATVQELRQCVDNLGILGARGGAAGLMALSVRAAVLARKGLAKLTYDQAEQVLHGAAEFMLEESEETEAELRSVAEASLIAALALFEVGAIPSKLAVLPRCYGSPFLRYRRDLAQHYLDVARAELDSRSNLLNQNVPHAYRSLVFSDLDCSREANHLIAHDEGFLQALEFADPARDLGLNEEPQAAVVKYLATSYECLRLLTLDDQAGAVEVAYRSDVLEPNATILKAIVLLATGRERAAKDMLDLLGEGRGARFEATRAVLRVAALLKLDHVESARSVLLRAQALPPAVLVQALTCVPPDDARTIAQMYPSFARFVEAALSAGVLGTGRHIGDTRRYEALTEKERIVLLKLREGLNTREIADDQFLSVNTVRTHVRSIGKKLDASGQAQMLRRAEELRIFGDR